MSGDREKRIARQRAYRERAKVAKYGPSAAGVNMSGRHGNHACPTSLALDQARADLRAYGGHTGTCAYDACDCGLAEALARAEGR